MRKVAVFMLVALALGAAGWWVIAKQKSQKATVSTSSQGSATHEQTTNSSSSTGSAPASNQQTAETDTVSIANYAYAPAAIKIKKGTKVTWTNKDGVGHTVTSDNDSKEVFDSPLLEKDQTFSYTFNQAGTFHYHCQPHPYMKGSVEVVE